MDAFLGVGVSNGRWAGVLLGDRQDVSVHGGTIAELFDAACAAERPRAIAVDMATGEPATATSARDAALRELLKGQVPANPQQAALGAARVEPRGMEMPEQSDGPAWAIRDLRDWLERGGNEGIPVLECHPDVCFAHMVNPRDPTPIQQGKRSWEGMRRRIQLLKGAGIDVQYIRDPSGTIGADDLVDASVCAWTARRHWAGNAVRYPSDASSGDPAVWA